MTLILPGTLDTRVTTVVQQMVSFIQSAHLPVFAHGVLQPSLTVFGGAAKLRIRSIPLSTSVTTLFIPATTMTVSGPYIISHTLLPAPSMFTSSPSRVRGERGSGRKDAELPDR